MFVASFAQADQKVYYAAQGLISIDFCIGLVILYTRAFNQCLKLAGAQPATFYNKRQRLYVSFATSYVPVSYIIAALLG